MIKIESQLNGVYCRLIFVMLDDPFPFATSVYRLITDLGAINDKHTPPQTISKLLNKYCSHDLLIFH